MDALDDSFDKQIFMISGENLKRLSEILTKNNQMMMREFLIEIRNDLTPPSTSDYISQDAANEISQYGKTRWAILRSTGAVEYTKIGKKILYSRSSLLELLQKNKREKF